MGNSEVGHLTIGSGRILFQDLMRVNRAIETGDFFENDSRCVGAFERGGNVHLLGLVSHGGVHSHIDHLQALLTFAPENEPWIHAFTDGRDVSPHSAVHDLAELPARPHRDRGRPLLRDGPRQALGSHRARVARDRATATASTRTTPSRRFRRATTRGITDEFIEPVVHRRPTPARPGDDAAIFFNFRPDRARQLSEKLAELGVDLTTMTRYRDDFDFPVVVPGARSSRTRLRRCSRRTASASSTSAETEKYAHVTYFFNGGREEPFAGETRILVDSPRDVPSYDHKPQMSAPRGRRSRSSAAIARTATASWSSTSRTRTWSATRA